MIEPPTGNGTEAARQSSFAGGASSAEAPPEAPPEAAAPAPLTGASEGKTQL